MNKKFSKILLSLGVTMGLFIPQALAAGSDYTSVTYKYSPADITGHWAEESLQDFVDNNNLAGYEDTKGNITVQPDKSITRAEFITLLVRALQLDTTGSGKTFSDVKSTDWFYNPVRIASNLNIVGGTTPTTFEPNRLITRAEIASMIERGFKNTVSFQGTTKSFPDVKGHWAEQSIQNVGKVGIIGGYPDGNFQPNKNATRAEAVTMLERSLQKESVGTLVDDQTLLNIAKSYVNIYTDINTTDYAKATDLENTYTTGYVKEALKDLTQGDMPLLASQGRTVKFINETEPTYQVIQKNARMAKVEYTNWTLTQEETKSDGTKTTDKHTYNGFFAMEKMTDGTWKVYDDMEYIQ